MTRDFQTTPGSSSQRPPNAPAKVLLVDDQRANRLALVAVLEGSEYELVEATTGEEALRLLEVQDFAVILQDLHLPETSGFELTRTLRTKTRNQHTPVIFLTAGDVTRGEEEQAYALDAVDFLTKPFSPFALQAKVRGLVNVFLDKQQALHEAEQLRLLVQGTNDYAIFMLDPQGFIATWNSGARRLKGYEAAEIIGKHFTTFYPEDALKRGWPEHELKVAAAEGRFEDEGWRVRKDGSQFWANVVITALRDENGELRGFSKVTRDLTERKRSEESLRQSEERFRLMVEAVQDYAIFRLDPQGNIASWNPGARRIKGYAAEEIIGRHFSVFYPQEAIDRGWPEHELKVAAAEGRFEDEGWRVRKDGTQFWANVVITALKDESGTLLGFSKITRDLTERKRSEENARSLVAEQAARKVAEESRQQIETSEGRLRLFVENAPAAVAMLDKDMRYLLVSRRWLSDYQLGDTDIVGRSHYEIFPDAPEHWKEIHRRCLAGASERSEEDRFERANGQVCWLRWEILPWHNAVGEIGGLLISSEDITARKAAEEQIREQKEWLAVTLASIGDAVITTDEHGHVTYLNGVAESLTGWPVRDAQGKPLEVVFPIYNEQTREPVENPVTKVLRHGTIVGLGNHTVLVAKDGTVRPIDDSAAPIKDAAGILLGVVLIFRDVTEQRQAEHELRESEARKAAILKNSLDCIITMDNEGRVVEFNPAAEATFGFSTQEVVGKELASFIIPPSLRERHRQGMLHYFATGIAPVLGKRIEMPALHADGSEFPVELAITQISEHGPPLFTAHLRDLREQKKADRQRGARLAVTQALADATSAEEGAIGVLKAVCENLNWDVGFIWTVDDAAESLLCRHTWNLPSSPATEFTSASCSRTFTPGEGLPGRVWATREPVWILDLAHDVNFPRLMPASQAGLRSAFACPILVNDQFLGVIEFFTQHSEQPDPNLLEMVCTVAGAVGQFLVRREAERELREQTTTAETLLRIGSSLAQELDLHKLVQAVTDESTKICTAQFGAFFYNVANNRGEAYTLYTVSGVPLEAFSKFPMPRNTELFGPTFRGEGVVRLDDVTKDPRYGKSAPHHGMPAGHLPVRSYLAVPVISRSGVVLGGLFFGHAEQAVFTAHHERLVAGIAQQAAVAIDNAQLFQSAQSSAERMNLAISAADLGDWSWDAATDMVNFSERAAAIFGIPPGPHMTWTAMQELLHPGDRERAKAEVERVVAERVQYDIEYRVNRPAGRTVWVGALGRALYDASDQLIGMYGVVQDITERKQLEESLTESESRFRGLMEQAPFSVQIFSPDGRTLQVNRAWEELWGVTIEQIDGYNILEDRQLESKGVLSFIQQAFRGEPAFVPAIEYDPNQTIPNQTRHEDPVRWVAAVAYPLKDETGTIREVVLVHDDITARRQAEGALRESEQRLRLALEAGRMGVWDWNIRTGELDWSDSLEPLHGLEPGTFGGTLEHFQELIHPEDRQSVNAAISQALERGGEFYVEFRNVWKNGGLHWIAGSGKVFCGEDGAPLRMIGVGLDVTARKRSEETARFLSGASAALSTLVDFESTLQKVASLAVPHFADWAAIDVLESEGTLRRVAVAHPDPAKIQLAKDLQKRFPPDPDSPRGAWNVIRTGKAELVSQITDEVLVASIKDNELLEIIRALGLRSSIAVPLTVRGRILGVLTFVVAESDHYYDETDLSVAQDLASRAAIAIENSQLYRELREADQRKDEFLATLAHELRNPLAPIRNGIQVLRLAGIENEMVVEARTMMERQLTQLVRLVDDLLDVSRITRNKLELKKERISLANVVHSAIETSRPLIEQFGHTFTVTLTASPVYLDADPVRLAQVFSNLLNNAAKYTPPGGAIQLIAERQSDEVEVIVRDNGLGIPAEALPRLFEMFSQVERNMERAQGGLGIGLTLVRRLTELHGGRIQVRSEGPGKGSEFIVRLPIIAEENEFAGQPISGKFAATGPKRRILVVDDNRDAAESLAMMLRLMGSDVRTASDGEAAVEAASEYRPDLILLDIGLPKLNGYEACRQIRKQPWGEKMVIVALTGWGQEEDRRRSQEAGFDHHLVKPVDIDDVTKLLARQRR